MSMGHDKTTQQKIQDLLNKRYNNYNGTAWQSLRELHYVIRRRDGEEGFLRFLEYDEKVNPKPVFVNPLTNENHTHNPAALYGNATDGTNQSR